MESIREWFRRHLSDPQVVLLLALLLGGLALIVLLGRPLTPVIAALVIAYVLDAPVGALERRRLPHAAAVSIVFVAFLGVIAVASLAVLPLVSQQLAQLVAMLPSMLSQVQDRLLELPDRYPSLVDAEQVRDFLGALRSELLQLGQSALRVSVGSIGNVVSVVAFAFIVPFLVFFLLKDRDRLVAWLTGFLPHERELATRVWRDVDRQIGAYIRGKIYEIGIVALVTWATFALLGVNLALLLAVLTGLSVLIPYVGVAVVTVPVALVAFFQFGASGEMAAVVGAYAVIQTLDGNLLAPLVISEAVDLHPVAVIVAILAFGGVWGLWGVFFAIPLATLVATIVNAWPREPGGEAAGASPGPPRGGVETGER